MNRGNSLNYLPVWLLLIVLAAGLFIYHRADYVVDMVTDYSPAWLWALSLPASLVIAVVFTWACGPASTKSLGAATVVLLFCVFGLMTTLPRLMLLANVPDAASPPESVELDVVYVRKKVTRSSFVGSRIGIRYGDSLIQFESSRTMYFLLQNKQCIQAEIGQAVPGLYYIRNLQMAPGTRQQASADYWRYWLRGVGTWAGYVAGFGLLAWLVSRIFRKQLRTIRL